MNLLRRPHSVNRRTSLSKRLDSRISLAYRKPHWHRWPATMAITCPMHPPGFQIKIIPHIRQSGSQSSDCLISLQRALMKVHSVRWGGRVRPPFDSRGAGHVQNRRRVDEDCKNEFSPRKQRGLISSTPKFRRQKRVSQAS